MTSAAKMVRMGKKHMPQPDIDELYTSLLAVEKQLTTADIRRWAKENHYSARGAIEMLKKEGFMPVPVKAGRVGRPAHVWVVKDIYERNTDIYHKSLVAEMRRLCSGE